MTITEMYCGGNRRYKAAEKFTPVGVVLHSIGTPQPSAEVLQRFWQNDGSPYVVHYMVDDKKILHCMPDNYKCWHVGSPGNAQYLGIEMGEPSQIRYTSGAAFTVSDLAAAQAYAAACYTNAVWLIAQLCRQHGWDPYTAVWTHYEITRQGLSNTDHVDPQHLWNGLGMGYDLARLRKDVAAAMKSSGSASAPATPPEPENPAAADQVYRIRKTAEDAASQIGAYSILANAIRACPDGYKVFDRGGKLVYPLTVRVTASALNVRSKPSTAGDIVNVLEKGWAYSIVDQQDGWGLLKAYAKDRNGWICLKYTEEVPS